MSLPPQRNPNAQPKKLRSGIGGIEKSLQQKAKLTDKEISKAFRDLDNLIEMAKPMVALAQNVSNKLKERDRGGILDDETVQLKSYLLSMGIADPVTKDSYGHGQSFFKELAKELNKVLAKPVEECGGMMTLTDAFCRLNRARGMELVSPEDLLKAAKASREVNCVVCTEKNGQNVLYL